MRTTKRIAYLGPAGTFTEEAVLLYDSTAHLTPLPSVPAVAASVEAGMADEGVVAIENSIEGSVNDTLDVLIHESRLRIRRELVLPINHYLLAQPSTSASAVQVIYSHPSALGQCRRFIERCFPKAQAMAALSTARAVEDMKNSPAPAAAIATRRAADIYGVAVLARNIQDNPANVTRFVVLAHEDSATPTGYDKTSICFSFDEDQAGQLYGVLGEFARRDINLTKVESRPSKESLGKYVFLMDLAGHREDTAVKEALEGVRSRVGTFKVLGSYPRYANSPASHGSP
ncbi:MAG: prephenate dehydratase [Chloroflexi bacterium]|nr:prephenate dehydratase [Chloroflexota bacterium]